MYRDSPFGGSLGGGRGGWGTNMPGIPWGGGHLGGRWGGMDDRYLGPPATVGGGGRWGGGPGGEGYLGPPPTTDGGGGRWRGGGGGGYWGGGGGGGHLGGVSPAGGGLASLMGADGAMPGIPWGGRGGQGYLGPPAVLPPGGRGYLGPPARIGGVGPQGGPGANEDADAYWRNLGAFSSRPPMFSTNMPGVGGGVNYQAPPMPQGLGGGMSQQGGMGGNWPPRRMGNQR